MKIIVGLGNIGDKYLHTRHNCGFLALDEFAIELKAQDTTVNWKEETKFKALIAKTTLKNQSLLLVKPTTLMNLSGESVRKILDFFKEPLENLIVIYDDIDLPLGKIRVREKGSAGTHNGIKSVIEALGSENFHRIRIGIESRGEHAPKQQDIHSFVLSDFLESEYPILKDSLKETITALKKILNQPEISA